MVESAEGTLSAVIPECERLAKMDHNGADNGDETTPTSPSGESMAKTPVRAPSVYHNYSSDTGTSGESKEEEGGPFNLITLIVSALLGISLIFNIILLFRGRKGPTTQTITITPKIQITEALDYCTELLESDFKPWNNILSVELGNNHNKK